MDDLAREKAAAAGVQQTRNGAALTLIWVDIDKVAEHVSVGDVVIGERCFNGAPPAGTSGGKPSEEAKRVERKKAQRRWWKSTGWHGGRPRPCACRQGRGGSTARRPRGSSCRKRPA